MRKAVLTAAVLLSTPVGTAIADEDDDDDDDLSEMSLEQLLAVDITTASKLSDQLSRAPGVAFRLSREDLEDRGYRELLDLFDDLPGMDVVRPRGDNYLKVYWRGYRTDVTYPFLLMIDGMAVNSLWTGDASVAAAMPISEIDHVEIVYGPASAVWGANAFMGVVNVITRRAEEDRLSLRVTTGTYHGERLDRRIVDGSVVRHFEGLTLSVAGRLALDWNDAAAGDRFEYTSSRYANDDALWGDYLDFENLARGNSSPIDEYGLDVRLRAGALELGAIWLSLETGYAEVYPTDRVQPYAHWVQEERTAFARYTDDITDEVSSSTLFRLRESGIPNRSYFTERDPGAAMPAPDISYWQARNRSASLTEDVTATITDEIHVLAGARYERKDLQAAYDTDYGTFDMLPAPPDPSPADASRPVTDDYGVYTEARLRRDIHTLHVGVRYDWNSEFGGEHSPTLRAGYVGELDTPLGLFLGKLLYGEAFEEPNPRELYGGWLGSGSNPTLRPESSRTVELNVSHTLDWLSNLVSVYYAANSDTITTYQGDADNKGHRDVVGVDYHVRALLRPPGLDSLSLWGFYSYIWTDELTFDAAGDAQHAPIGDLASHKVWFGGTAKARGRYTATLRSRGVATRDTVATNPLGEIRGYLVFDATLSASRIHDLPITIALDCNNLLGTHYSHPGVRTADSGDDPGRFLPDGTWSGSAGWYSSRLPQPGRSVMLTLGLDL